MEIALLAILFLVGGIASANQMMKLLERRQRLRRRDRGTTISRR